MDSVKLYLKQIAKYRRLSIEEEKQLGKQIHLGDVAAKEKMIKHNLALVVFFAKKYLNKNNNFLDLIQQGNLGLIKAVEKYDPNKDNCFSTYASWWIRQSLSEESFEKNRTIKIPSNILKLYKKIKKTEKFLFQELNRDPTLEEIALSLGLKKEQIQNVLSWVYPTISLNSLINSFNNDEKKSIQLEDLIKDNIGEDFFDKDLRRQAINKILKTLNEREQFVIIRRFGLNGYKEQTLEEIGQQLNISGERVRQIEKDSLKKLRNPKRLKIIKEF